MCSALPLVLTDKCFWSRGAEAASASALVLSSSSSSTLRRKFSIHFWLTELVWAFRSSRLLLVGVLAPLACGPCGRVGKLSAQFMLMAMRAVGALRASLRLVFLLLLALLHTLWLGVVNLLLQVLPAPPPGSASSATSLSYCRRG